MNEILPAWKHPTGRPDLTLIGPLMDLETVYRQEIVLSLDVGESHAKAEAKAKAGQAYAQWRKLQMVHDLAEHQINFVKKFKDELQAEKYRS